MKISNTNLKALLSTAKAYENKLIELMGKEAFSKFSIEVAKNLFFDSIQEIEDSDFRNFCLDNFDNITGVANNSDLDFPNSTEGG